MTAACARVAATLADGPDPSADPVGHAEAQIIPLRKIHSSDPALQAALRGLDSGYARLYETNGAKRAERLLSRAVQIMNGICPGAAP